MSKKLDIKSLLKEAELYRSQGLLAESRQKYLMVLEFIEKKQPLGDGNKLLNAIMERIRMVEEQLDEIDQTVKKISDNFLYNLTRLNPELSKTQICVVGIRMI